MAARPENDDFPTSEVGCLVRENSAWFTIPGLRAVENLARIRHRGIAQVAQGPQRPAGLAPRALHARRCVLRHLVPKIRDVRDSLISEPGAKSKSKITLIQFLDLLDITHCAFGSIHS